MVREQSRTLCRLDDSFVARLHALVPTGSRGEVEDVLRISWNTWIKIRVRKSIRYSLAHRLVERVLDIEGDHSDPMDHLILTSGGDSAAAGVRVRSVARQTPMQAASARTAATAR